MRAGTTAQLVCFDRLEAHARGVKELGIKLGGRPAYDLYEIDLQRDLRNGRARDLVPGRLR